MEFEYGKRWLARARVIERQIWELEDEIESYEVCLKRAGINYDKISVKSSPENHFENIMCEIAECYEAIKKLNSEKTNVLHEINKKLDEMEVSSERYILRAFYVNHHSISEIAKNLNYSESRCYELRKKGIESL